MDCFEKRNRIIATEDIIPGQVVLQVEFESKDWRAKTWKGSWRKNLIRIKDSIPGDINPISLKKEME